MIMNDHTPSCLEHEELFSEVTALVRDYVIRNKDKSTKVIDFKTPDELRKLVNFHLQDEGIDNENILEICRAVLKYSVNTCHSRFYNQLFRGVDEVGLLAAFLTSATNTSMYTYEMAPVFSLMELEVLSRMREFVGWEGGEGDGIFSPGGSISNLYGLMLARYKKFPESKMKGMQHLPQMAIFCSEDAHYSILKSSIVMGIGIDNVIEVKSDHRGKMIVEELDRKIIESKEKGLCPLAVVATAATTVLGAFDPIDEVATICEKHSVWMHVDGCFGGSILMSNKHRNILDGIQRADSVTWNPHKSLGVPLQCSTFLTQHKNILNESNSTHATYLFQQDKIGYDVSHDTGDKSIQCGRLNDVFKLWLMWKQRGTCGFEKAVDRSLEMARCLADKISSRDGYQLIVKKPEYTNVCFWYFPPKMRGLYPFTLPSLDPLAASRMSKVAPIIKARMIEKGSLMLTYQLMKDLPNFFRMTLTTPATEEDLDWLLDEIELLGTDIDI